MICSLSLITIVLVLVGVAFGMIGFKKNTSPSERTKLSHCGGIILLMYVPFNILDVRFMQLGVVIIMLSCM